MEINYMELNTNRLILRPITADDAEDMYEYSKDECVGLNAGWKPHESISETMEIMNLIFIGADCTFGIILKDSGKLIGSAGLIDDPKRENERVRMLGYSIGKDYWGRGYMTEAAKAIIDCGFTNLDIDMVSAYCYPDNVRSKRVLEKLGFVYEGKLSECEKLYNGSIKDNECFALKRAEWLKNC